MQRVLCGLIIIGLSALVGCAEKQAKTAQTSGRSQDKSKVKTDTVVEPTNETKPQTATKKAANDLPSPDKSKTETETKKPADDLPPPKLNLELTGTMSAAEAQKIANEHNRPGDWNQWCGSPLRNNVVTSKVPTEFEAGEFDDQTGEWKKETSKNVKYAIALGSQTYGNTVVANGKLFIGTNNGAGYLKRYPADVDLGVFLCLDEKDGKFLWQDSNEKLPTGRVNDWPGLGVCSSPLVDGNRVYYVSNRGELRCLDTEGFRDGKNDGPITNEKEKALAAAKKDSSLKLSPEEVWDEEHEADVVWVFDMMRELGVSQHNMANCSVTMSGDYLFICTSNGVDEAHTYLPAPHASSFIAVDKRNGKLIWSDNTPGINVLHGQWSSPAYAVIDGEPQVIFGGGDGWLYGFDPRGEKGKSKILWKFDCNPKDSVYKLTGATRNHIIGTPVIYDNKVYIAVGEDPEHGEGVGHLWCIDPTKRGDISPELVFNSADPAKPIEHKRNQAVVKEDGDFARPNPNSAAIWHYSTFDKNENGKIEFEETMHRTMGTVAIKDDLLFVADFSGLLHCLDAKTGKPYWAHDMLAVSWGSLLIAGDYVYLGDEDGEVSVIKAAKELEVVHEARMGSSVYSMPIVANGVLYITNQSYLFAIADTEMAAAKRPAATLLGKLK
jgi:outer membrane protein assembly factor BamB